MTDDEATVRGLYEGFNRRDIPAVLALLSKDVVWANGMNDGHEHGHAAVRAYWTAQWEAISPHVEPGAVARRDDGAVAIEVRQVVHDLAGKLLLDEEVCHIFRLRDGLVSRFDIQNAGGLSSLDHG